MDPSTRIRCRHRSGPYSRIAARANLGGNSFERYCERCLGERVDTGVLWDVARWFDATRQTPCGSGTRVDLGRKQTSVSDYGRRRLCRQDACREPRNCATRVEEGARTRSCCYGPNSCQNTNYFCRNGTQKAQTLTPQRTTTLFCVEARSVTEVIARGSLSGQQWMRTARLGNGWLGLVLRRGPLD